MGIAIFIAFVLVIGILGYLLVFVTNKPAIPPYQEPLNEKSEAKFKLDANWPFPPSKP